MEFKSNIWTVKGATLSDKNASKEYGITQEEIIEGIRAGKLQYKAGHAHGNPYYKIIRKEVELYITDKYGAKFLKKMNVTTKLNQVTSELRKLKRQIKSLGKEKEILEEKLKELES